MNLTDSDLALYTTFILTCPYRPGLKDVDEIQCLNKETLSALKINLSQNHMLQFEGLTALETLMNMGPQLRELKLLHQEALSKFKKEHPNTELSTIYENVFN